jgi:hypothetical protein
MNLGFFRRSKSTEFVECEYLRNHLHQYSFLWMVAGSNPRIHIPEAGCIANLNLAGISCIGGKQRDVEW